MSFDGVCLKIQDDSCNNYDLFHEQFGENNWSVGSKYVNRKIME